MHTNKDVSFPLVLCDFRFSFHALIRFTMAEPEERLTIAEVPQEINRLFFGDPQPSYYYPPSVYGITTQRPYQPIDYPPQIRDDLEDLVKIAKIALIVFIVIAFILLLILVATCCCLMRKRNNRKEETEPDYPPRFIELSPAAKRRQTPSSIAESSTHYAHPEPKHYDTFDAVRIAASDVD